MATFIELTPLGEANDAQGKQRKVHVNMDLVRWFKHDGFNTPTKLQFLSDSLWLEFKETPDDIMGLVTDAKK